MGCRVTAYGPSVRSRRSPPTSGAMLQDVPSENRAHRAKTVEAISTATPRNRTHAASTVRFCTTPRPRNRIPEHTRNVAASSVTDLDSGRIRSSGAYRALYSAPAIQTATTIAQQAPPTTRAIWSFISTTVIARRPTCRARCYRPGMKDAPVVENVDVDG